MLVKDAGQRHAQGLRRQNMIKRPGRASAENGDVSELLVRWGRAG